MLLKVDVAGHIENTIKIKLFFFCRLDHGLIIIEISVCKWSLISFDQLLCHLGCHFDNWLSAALFYSRCCNKFVSLSSVFVGNWKVVLWRRIHLGILLVNWNVLMRCVKHTLIQRLRLLLSMVYLEPWPVTVCYALRKSLHTDFNKVFTCILFKCLL